MTVYVHEPLNDAPTRGDSAREDGAEWSHVAINGDEAELIAFAETIGLDRDHLQGRAIGRLHFDLTRAQHQATLAAGAVMVSSVEFLSRCFRATHPRCRWSITGMCEMAENPLAAAILGAPAAEDPCVIGGSARFCYLDTK